MMGDIARTDPEGAAAGQAEAAAPSAKGKRPTEPRRLERTAQHDIAGDFCDEEATPKAQYKLHIDAADGAIPRKSRLPGRRSESAHLMDKAPTMPRKSAPTLRS